MKHTNMCGSSHFVTVLAELLLLCRETDLWTRLRFVRDKTFGLAPQLRDVNSFLGAAPGSFYLLLLQKLLGYRERHPPLQQLWRAHIRTPLLMPALPVHRRPGYR